MESVIYHTVGNVATATRTPRPRPIVRPYTGPFFFLSVQYPSINRGSSQDVLVVSERTNYIKFSVLGNNRKPVPGVHVSSINLTRGFWLLVISTDAHKTTAGTERLVVIGVSGKQSFKSAISSSWQ